MPILDPILQFNLSSTSNSKSDADPKYFYINYLQIASERINENIATILASNQFKKDFESCISVLSDRFSMSFKGNKDEFPNLYFSILYQNNELDTSKKFNFQGKYYQYTIFNSTFNFFNVSIDNNTYRTWFLSDFPIAVLCLKMSDIKYEHLNLITLELNLMAAAGFTIVVCINNFSKCKITNFDRLIEILSDHFISEIHVTYDSDEYNEPFNNFVKSLIVNYSKFKSYFYFYVRYFELEDEQLNQLVVIPILDLSKKENKENKDTKLIQKLIENLNQLKLKPRMKITYFSDSIKESLKEINPIRKKFKFCTNGFEKKTIKIILSDIPLYDKENVNESIFSCDFANVGIFTYHCLMKKEDFLSFYKDRVKVLYYNGSKIDKNSNEEKIYKFVDSADIHYMNNKLYIKNQLSLVKTKSTLKKKCYSIIEQLLNNHIPKEPNTERTTKNSPRKNKKGEKNKNDECSLDEIFIKSLYNYKVFHDQKYNWRFDFHLNQIYAAYEIIDSCFNLNSKGFGSIYRIPTGEGKSAIILLIAAVLAQKDKKIHIVTSNYILANRDYNEYYDYFKNLGLNSTALLHFNEVPIYNTVVNDPTIKIDHYPEEFFGRDLFANSLSMNFAACKNKNASIIFSTISNFECFYLYMTEKSKENIDDYYRKTVLLVDEADSILIDEITNGTIISRQLNSNCEDVLSHVYNSYIENNKISASKLHEEITEKWSNCTDLTESDVENMLKELKLVLKDPFVDGKKYLIVNTNKRPTTDKSNEIQYKEIVPFDFDNKGIIPLLSKKIKNTVVLLNNKGIFIFSKKIKNTVVLLNNSLQSKNLVIEKFVTLFLKIFH